MEWRDDLPEITDAPQGSPYTEYTFDVVGTAGQSTLQFTAENDSAIGISTTSR